MPFPNWIGKERFWTKERVLAALARATQEIQGPLPVSDDEWYKVKRGRLYLPSAQRVYYYFHSFPLAWIAAGAPESRISLAFSKWTRGEDNYLKENAGKLKLEELGRRLHRSYGSVCGRLRYYGIQSRNNQGYMSAAQLSKEFNCPVRRIWDGLGSGIIKARFHPKVNTWLIDVNQLSPAARELLTRSKRTWKTRPTDRGDYDHRHGLIRKVIDGKVTRVKVLTT